MMFKQVCLGFPIFTNFVSHPKSWVATLFKDSTTIVITFWTLILIRALFFYDVL